MENPRYDKLLRALLYILEHDYAGLAIGDQPVDSRYYVQAAGMAWKKGTLDDLLFLRFGSQMLATTLDRSLRLRLSAPGYAPWRPGFDVRRVADSLYVTGVQEEHRLRPGDRILRLNSSTPDTHVQQFQKNFLYATEAEREIWSNVLKMTRHVLVEHADGAQENMPLAQFAAPRPACAPALHAPKPGTLVLKVGDIGDGSAIEALVYANQAALDDAGHLILDLRHTHDGEEDDLLPLIPYVLSGAKTMSEATGVQTLCTLYTKDNCRRKTALLAPFAGVPEADALIAKLNERSGAGFVQERLDLWEDEPQILSPRGHRVTLLQDTWCEGAAESFVLLAKREGRATLMGRPTMGSLDYANRISVSLCDTLVFTYPMSITLDAMRGQGTRNRGVTPDVYIPFTPQECTEDVIERRAAGL